MNKINKMNSIDEISEKMKDAPVVVLIGGRYDGRRMLVSLNSPDSDSVVCNTFSGKSYTYKQKKPLSPDVDNYYILEGLADNEASRLIAKYEEEISHEKE